MTTQNFQNQSASAQVVTGSRDAIVLLNADGTILDVNPAALVLFGRPPGDMLERSFLDLINIPNAPFVGSGPMRAVDYMMLGVIERPEARAMPVEISLIALEGGDNLYAAQLRSIVMHAHVETELQRLAYYDSTTHLPNRYATLNHVDDLLAGGTRFIVLHLNLDRFRILKNSLGHDFGDKVLVVIADQLRVLSYQGIWVSRLGGDEFVVIVPDAEPDDIETLSADIQHLLARQVVVEDRQIHLKCSIGVVDVEGTGHVAAQILSDAEIAAFQAKIAGGGTYAIFDQPMRESLIELQRTEADLRLAVQQDDQLWVAYQPIVDLQTGDLAGFEALVRWDHPEFGTIPPAEFIPLAEATGLIVPLGADVLTEACRAASRWIQLVGPTRLPFISVNLSLRQLGEGNFIEHAKQLLEETGLQPGTLKLEITESTLMTNPEDSIRKLEEIRALGIQLSIDDFGTGYSSLAYLHRLPVKTLKIDRSFVTRLDESNDREIVRIITELARILKLDVIAEGVERLSDIQALRALGCQYGQGFLFDKPLSAEDAEQLLVDGKTWRETVEQALVAST